MELGWVGGRGMGGWMGGGMVSIVKCQFNILWSWLKCAYEYIGRGSLCLSFTKTLNFENTYTNLVPGRVVEMIVELNHPYSVVISEKFSICPKSIILETYVTHFFDKVNTL